MKLFTPWFIALALVGCDKKAETPPEPAPVPAPAAGTTATPEPAVDAAAPAPAADAAAPAADAAAPAADTAGAPAGADAAAADSAELTQCKAILVKSLAAVKPTIAKLGVTVDAALEARYLGDQGYLDACVKLPQDKRDCLAAADHPVAAIDTCQVNEPKRVLWAFDFGREIDLWPSAPLPEEEAKALTTWIAGTWVNDWTAANERQTWTIGADGKVESAEVVKRGTVDPKANVPDTLTFKETRKLHVLWKGSTTTQTLAFFKENDDTFYASTNTLYDAYPVEDDKRFVVRHQWEYVAFDGGQCEVIVGSGLSIPARCEFAKDKGRRLFKTEYQRPGASRPTTMTHVVIGKHFMVDSMSEAARFVRKK